MHSISTRALRGSAATPTVGARRIGLREILRHDFVDLGEVREVGEEHVTLTACASVPPAAAITALMFSKTRADLGFDVTGRPVCMVAGSSGICPDR